MIVTFLKQIFTLLVLSSIVISPYNIFGQNKTSAHIYGELSIDDTWDSKIYLSHIPTYDEMYAMSNEMIIAKTEIDSLGYFKFDLDFLPRGENLYRLHIIKKGDTPATLIIGGKDENHLFFIMDRFANIKLKSDSSYPPFKNVEYNNSLENRAFQHVTNLVYIADSIAAESTASKRSLIENQMIDDLLKIADTSNNFHVSLYAIYKSKFESNFSSNLDFYKSYDKRWRNQNNAYYKVFSEKLPTNNKTNIATTEIIIIVALVLFFSITGFFLGQHGFKKTKNFEKLSVQERKIYEFLQKGATNQEISNHFNIGLSTVKSHVSSILSKLKVKSRKEILNRK